MIETDLSALPQPVREAVELFDIDAEKVTRYTRHDDWQTIRAELLRVYGENAELRGLRHRHECDCGACDRARDYASLESELAQMKSERDAVLASNRDCMDWFEQMRVDYYALRKRIAEAPIYEMPLRKPTDEAGWCAVIASAKALKEARGKRVALLAMTDEDKA